MSYFLRLAWSLNEGGTSVVPLLVCSTPVQTPTNRSVQRYSSNANTNPMLTLSWATDPAVLIASENLQLRVFSLRAVSERLVDLLLLCGWYYWWGGRKVWSGVKDGLLGWFWAGSGLVPAQLLWCH